MKDKGFKLNANFYEAMKSVFQKTFIWSQF